MGEYGSFYGRPHFHIVIYSNDLLLKSARQPVLKIGLTTIGIDFGKMVKMMPVKDVQKVVALILRVMLIAILVTCKFQITGSFVKKRGVQKIYIMVWSNTYWRLTKKMSCESLMDYFLKEIEKYSTTCKIHNWILLALGCYHHDTYLPAFTNLKDGVKYLLTLNWHALTILLDVARDFGKLENLSDDMILKPLVKE